MYLRYTCMYKGKENLSPAELYVTHESIVQYYVVKCYCDHAGMVPDLQCPATSQCGSKCAIPFLGDFNVRLWSTTNVCCRWDLLPLH